MALSFELFRSDGPLSGAAFFCACEGAAWPVVLFSSGFCAPFFWAWPWLIPWPVVDDDWLLDCDDELLDWLSDFTLTLPCSPRALTVRVSMRPLASKPSLRWKVISASRVS